MSYRKKLIEVALPLEAINMESAREKSIRHGHPSTLHLWWARRPLAACRAVLWASLVDDPSSWPERFPTEEEQRVERQRLFDILGRIVVERDKKGNEKQVVRGLVSWDDVNDPKSGVLVAAQREIARCLAWGRGEEPPEVVEGVRAYIGAYGPPVYDPFAGGGSIPLEGQRLGLEAHASDLNPVAVLINKALIEIPPRFKGLAPINEVDRAKKSISDWHGAQGLAADVRFYGAWMRDVAFERIGGLYPRVRIPPAPLKKGGDDDVAPLVKGGGEAGGIEATVIAWLWARTVRCSNPGCGCAMPLVRSFQLSTKKGREAWVEPVVDHGMTPPQIRFVVRSGEGDVPGGTVERKGAICVACGTAIPLDYVRKEGRAGRMGAQLMAIVAEGKGGRVYLAPTDEQERIANSAQPHYLFDTLLPEKAIGISPQNYGMQKHTDLFTNRQLVLLETFCSCLKDLHQKMGDCSDDYKNAVATYLAISISKLADYNSSLSIWSPSRDQAKGTFARQVLPMVWDFCEVNPFAMAAGDFSVTISGVSKFLEGSIPVNALDGVVYQMNASDIAGLKKRHLISTDPPYYDNVPYANLSDFFYVWLRASLKEIHGDLFKTVLVPKKDEIIAEIYRHGGKKEAKCFFESRLEKTFTSINKLQDSGYPITIFYAFKQEEESEPESISSTGWETILEALNKANLAIDGTWPLRTERSARMRSLKSNALATSIVLVCRPRPANAPSISRRQLLREMQTKLPPALKTLQQGNIAPVDLAQASIGPGMAIFSQYSAVLETDGTPLNVRTALQIINQHLDQYLTDQDNEFDNPTRFALTWFQQYPFTEGPYGEAETLSKARNLSLQTLVDQNILHAKAGKVRLLTRPEIIQKESPNPSHWHIAQTLIHTLDHHGETGTAERLAQLPQQTDIPRDLAYRLYSLCDKKGWTQEAIAYNSLVISWPEITRLANTYQPAPLQTTLDL
ncbi:DUF1156 domain-containing protein [Spirulina sp. CCNP1310]|uniref:DUF1156 domain-containing protein n=1 Tax=Spirulina sp. CCNP1310 TaxID=3110249 RepID=UPI002B218FC5|nr:DUF1156 domain-containing protein [Spirulina sp. CCNP1310]MEA5420499.1 DUF1156 domain-containing protein [Spirulina sp. CCNP1310]